MAGKVYVSTALLEACIDLKLAMEQKDRTALAKAANKVFAEVQYIERNGLADVETPVKSHHHCIFTHCWDCHVWGTNLPGDNLCSNCGSTHTTEYTPND